MILSVTNNKKLLVLKNKNKVTQLTTGKIQFI